MSSSQAIEDWLKAYVSAWCTDAPRGIGALFTPEARYFTAPYESPLVGSDAIATWWIGQGESKLRWTFNHEVIADRDNLYVVRGVTSYEASAASGPAEVYYNIWLVTLAEDGRCSEFVEYWMLQG